MSTRLSIYDDCTFAKVNERLLAYCKPFSCGDPDLDDFFLNDALAYEKDLMGKTYCWVRNEDITQVIGFIPLFPRIDDEKDFYHIKGDELKTRMYYYDLLLLK